MQFSSLLALRLLYSAKYEQTRITMILVCIISLTVGTFALTLIAAIANGFEKETNKKLQSIHSDIIITSNNLPINEKKLVNVLHKDFKNYIEDISPIATNQVIIQKNNDQISSNALIIKGIDPISYFKVSKLESMLKNKKRTLSKILESNSILIGNTLAKKLNIKEADTLKLLFQPDQISSNKITLESEEVKIGGIFNTGIAEFDEYIIYCSLELFKRLFSNGVTEFAVKLKDIKDEKKVIDLLKKRLPLEIYSWKDLYPSLISAQQLEKYALLIIIFLVIIISAMNIISLLYIYITQKNEEIALLKTLGASDNSLIFAFILIGLIITTISSIIGIFLAIICVYLLNHYPFIKLPDIYYVSTLPANLDWQIILMVLITVFSVSLIALYIPTRKIRNINIIKILKNEII